MTGKISRAAVAFLAAGSLLPAPVPAQNSPGGGQTQQAPSAPGANAQAAPSLPAAPRSVDLQLDYSREKKWFPNLPEAYRPGKIPEPSLTNSPRIEQLVQNGKLMLSLQDAISL